MRVFESSHTLRSKKQNKTFTIQLCLSRKMNGKSDCRQYATEKHEEISVNVSWFCHFAVNTLNFCLFLITIIEFSPHEMSVFPINICFIKPWVSNYHMIFPSAVAEQSGDKSQFAVKTFSPLATESDDERNWGRWAWFPREENEIVWWKWWNKKDILNIRFVYLLAINT